MLDIVACLREPPGWVIVFNAAFNNITVILWLSFLLVEETRVPGKNHLPAANHWQALSHNVFIEYTLPEWDSNSHPGVKISWKLLFIISSKLNWSDKFVILFICTSFLYSCQLLTLDWYWPVRHTVWAIRSQMEMSWYRLQLFILNLFL